MKKVIRASSNLLSRSTYEIHRRNLIWNQKKYNEAMLKNVRSSVKRKATTVDDDVVEAKKTNEVEKDVE